MKWNPFKSVEQPAQEQEVEMSIEDEAKKMAQDLKSGERRWFFNGGDEMKLAVPLSMGNMDEFGGPPHSLTSEEEVRAALEKGEISNDHLVQTILDSLES